MKEILIKYRFRTRLAKHFNVCTKFITLALRFESNSILAREIRAYALNKMNGIIFDNDEQKRLLQRDEAKQSDCSPQKNSENENG